ncbi:MAG TPA: BatD family protein [Puia sp.]|jgi:hypothetical protein
MNPEQPIKSSIIGTVIRIPLLLWIALLPGLFVTGQVKFTTVASSQEIGRGDYLQIEFVVENAKQIDQLTPPGFPGFHIAQGPIQSSGMSIMNGNMSQYKALSFVLQPSKTGKYTIGGASAMVDGKHMQSNSITITVTATSSGSANNNNNNSGNGNNSMLPPSWPDPFGNSEPPEVDREYILKPGENIKDKIHKNLFVKVQVSKNSCYVGEPIVATYKLYSRLSSESRVTKRPSLNGFSVYDMIDPNTDAVSVEKLNGKAFTVHIIRKTQLIPLQAGTIDLDPVEVENTVHFVKGGVRSERRHSGNAIRDLFDQLTDDDAAGPEVDENVTLDTKPVSITVKPLPEENKPANFNGAVGNFSIEASVPNRDLSAQDESTLHVVVRGKGNLPVINAPQLSWPNGIEAFDPTAREDVNKTVAPMTGSKSFDYIFTPRTPGHYTIPAVSFPYFDPIAQSYKTAASSPLEIQVAPASGRKASSSASAGGVSGNPVRQSIRSRLGMLVQQHLEWIFTVIILSLIAVYLWRQNIRLKKTSQEEKEVLREAEAQKAEDHVEKAEGPGTDRQGNPIPELLSSAYLPTSIVADPLQEARQALENSDYKSFYRDLNRAVWKAISKKLSLPASELNKSNIIRHLQARGWDAHTILSLENILNECEMNLYTPAYDQYNMQQLLRQTQWMLERLA